MAIKFSKATFTHAFYDHLLLSKTTASDRLNRNWVYDINLRNEGKPSCFNYSHTIFHSKTMHHRTLMNWFRIWFKNNYLLRFRIWEQKWKKIYGKSQSINKGKNENKIITKKIRCIGNECIYRYTFSSPSRPSSLGPFPPPSRPFGSGS